MHIYTRTRMNEDFTYRLYLNSRLSTSCIQLTLSLEPHFYNPFTIPQPSFLPLDNPLNLADLKFQHKIV